MIEFLIIVLLFSLASLLVAISAHRAAEQFRNELTDLRREDMSLNNLVSELRMRIEALEKKED